MNPRCVLPILMIALAGSTFAGLPTTMHGPALAAYDGELYLAFSSADSRQRIHVAKVRPDGTILRSTRLGSSTSRTPALAEYGGRLWMAFRSADRGGRLYVQSFDGKAWAQPHKLGFRTRSGPALAEHEGQLHLVWRGTDNDSLYHASYDGRAWSDSTKLQFGDRRGANVEKAPVLASHGGRLYLLYNSRGENIWVASMRDGAWDVGPGPESGWVSLWPSHRAAAIAVADGTLYAGVVAPGGQILLRSRRSDDWRPEPDLDRRTGRRVSLAALGRDLYIASTHKDSDKIRVQRVGFDRWTGTACATGSPDDLAQSETDRVSGRYRP